MWSRGHEVEDAIEVRSRMQRSKGQCRRVRVMEQDAADNSSDEREVGVAVRENEKRYVRLQNNWAQRVPS